MPPLYQDIELRQPYAIHRFFTHVTNTGAAEDAVGGSSTVSLGMDVVNKASFRIDDGAAYVRFDADAAVATGTPSRSSSIYMPANSTYSDDNITIDIRISIIRATSTNVRITGTLWGRN